MLPKAIYRILHTNCPVCLALRRLTAMSILAGTLCLVPFLLNYMASDRDGESQIVVGLLLTINFIILGIFIWSATSFFKGVLKKIRSKTN